MKYINFYVVIALVASALPSAAKAQLTTLHEFVGFPTDGDTPFGNLTLIDSTLYGTTNGGGANGRGTIFAINTNGTGHTLLHEFAAGTADGGGPRGSFTRIGSTLYGTTQDGGANFLGTIFSIETDGTGFSIVHDFAVADGVNPLGDLLLDGSTFYGMTSGGGSQFEGTIYSVNTDGTGLNVLHNFLFGPSDGESPQGRLVLSGNTLYGMTPEGGTSGLGTIFSINTDGTGYSILHEFAGGEADGRQPFGSLTLNGSTLYGMTFEGGDSDLGTIFSINADGTGFTLLREFTGIGTDGGRPSGSLSLVGSTLFGMTRTGQSNGFGGTFSMSTDGTGYSELYAFDPAMGDGYIPLGDLTIDGSRFYGTTSFGGTFSNGTVFRLVPEPSALSLAVVGLIALVACRPTRRLRA